MSYNVWRSRYRSRYVNDVKKAEQEAARRQALELAQEPTQPEQATSQPCMSDFEAYGAVCPPDATCGATGMCARWARRQALIVACRGVVLKARQGV